MVKETDGFAAMGYGRDMGKSMAGSIGGVMHTKATRTDVDKDRATLASYGANEGALRSHDKKHIGRSSKHRHHKKRK
jgi:hypothetical protein